MGLGSGGTVLISGVIDRLNGPGPAAQLVRFVVTGGFVTLLGAALYTALVLWTPLHPQGAMLTQYILCVIVGYNLHSRISFRGHGGRGNAARTTSRFVAVSLVSYALNAFWTWACIEALHLPEWTPVVPLIFVTPLVVFVLNRQWVFR
jgi:putative flippase GtrA